ncbi:anti sigma factor C-terminal domain-containing protein [Bacillus manliponensis]|uniref:anti sigma factor C-terminal domain-containing protein n=1 Tax=Bacillus manliponensis TaxID=574376 RepID=UPI0035135722
MNCEDAKELWEKYESGTITDEEQEQLEEHIGTCAICEARLDELLAKYEKQKRKLPPIDDVHVPFWKIKWKHRIKTIALTISAIILIYAGGTFLAQMYYMSDNENRVNNMQGISQLVIETTMPNVRNSGSSINITPFFGAEITSTLFKRVGEEEIPIGEITIENSISDISIKKQWREETYYEKLSFAHPKTQEVEGLQENNINTWGTLQKLPEGTVAELAVSFKKAYSLQEVESILYESFGAQEVPPSVIWYAMDTGQEITNGDSHFSNFQVFGFPNDFYAYDLSYDELKEKEISVVERLSTLAKHEDVVRDMGWYDLDELQLKKRYEHVKKNGVKIYGVVLTGPTKELLKLQHSKEVRFASLGRVELWNGLNHVETELLE